MVAWPLYGSVHGDLPLEWGNGGEITGVPTFSKGDSKVTKSLILLAPVLLLSGCLFVVIPVGAIEAAGEALTGSEGAHCVWESVKVGDTLPRREGGTWTVKSLSGLSSRCKDPAKPIRALLIAS